MKFGKLATHNHQPWWQHSIWPWFLWIITVSSLSIFGTSNATLEALFNRHSRHCKSLLSDFTLFVPWFSATLYNVLPSVSFYLTESILPLLVSSCQHTWQLRVLKLWWATFRVDMRLLTFIVAHLCNSVCNALVWWTHIHAYIHR